jgi:hypothetical protein
MSGVNRSIRRVRMIALAIASMSLATAAFTRSLSAQQEVVLSAAERTEVAAYALSMDKIGRVISTMSKLNQLQESDPAMNAAVTGMAGKRLTEQATLLAALPKAAALLRAARMSAHEYAVGLTAFFGAWTIAARQARGVAVPPALQARFPASAAQIAFVTAHKTEIDALMRAAMQGASR